jgi:hypothetical protein
MRSDGVPNFPDPGPNGFELTPSNPITQSPAFHTAFNACQRYLPQSEHSPPLSASQRRQGLEFAQCMRSHGVPNFPDPGPNGAIQFPVTSPIPKSLAFRRAQSGPCHAYLSR